MEPNRSPDELLFYVNGRKVIEKNADPRMTLLTYLRRKLGLPGTKLGCGEGGCGACTVMVSRFNQSQNRIVHYSVNACLAPLCSLHHTAVTTVEGIGSSKTRLHPIQERIAKSHGSQCGFCTPGIVMSMYTLIRNTPEPTMEDIENSFQGNLCRCTGYRPILEGFKTFTKEACCGKRSENDCCRDMNCANEDISVSSALFDPSAFKPLDPTQEPIFPPELLMYEKSSPKSLYFKGDNITWLRPSNLEELLALKVQYPDAKLVVGNTEVGIETKFKNMQYPLIIAPGLVPELNIIEHKEEGIYFGAACSLSTMEEVLRKAVAHLPAFKTEVFRGALEQLRWFAGQQIRNVASIGGNIMTASPISDLNPVFMASGTKLHLISKDSTRTVHMDETFFTEYRKTVVTPQEILLSIEIPYSTKWEYFSAFKQASRREDDIAIVTSGMRVLFKPDSHQVESIRLSYGGMAPVTVMAKNTCMELAGKYWDDKLLQSACQLLAKEMALSPSVPGGMVEYRQTLTLSFFFKFYLTVHKKLALDLNGNNNFAETIPPKYESATELFHKSHPCSVQLFQEVPKGQKEEDMVGRPMVHLSAAKQATGEAVYCDDMPHYENELYLALITSTKAHAKIISIDTEEAALTPGFVCFLFAKDVPASNVTGFAHDETIFAEDVVTCVGHVIGGVVADTQENAQRAAKLVKVSYEELKPIITIQEAIEQESFYKPIKKIENGDIDKGFKEADHIVEGEIYIGGQEHFYLETNCSIAVPKGEDGEIELFVSTQNTTKTQDCVASALGVSSNKIVVRVKRMGGGFGGKESRCIIVSTSIAVAAHKTGRPVRCMLDRDEDMLITGGRHPYLGRYKVGFKKNGKITALDICYYANAGNSVDLSHGIIDRTLFHMDNTYKIPNIRGRGIVCKTNLPSNTAFRGFGGPQGMLVVEAWMNDIIQTCGLPAEQVRQLNLYSEGDLTHFNQKLESCTVHRCWEECLKQANYQERKHSIEEFNRQHRWKKRGITIIPTKFGISFTAAFLNQAGALVHVYTDGSVLLTHGGTEMGQGLHTKMVQVASKALGIPTSKIFISETSTNTVPNTSPTAASVSSDLNGMAILNACQIILQRLEPYKNSNPDGSWESWISAAYLDRVSLSATGFYKIPCIGYDAEKNEGRPSNYFSYGAACSEVEIDCLTGDHKNLRTDIVMDVGTSLNPAIDIGQAVGEPPLFLSSSIFFAIKEAITAARAESRITGPFRLDSPATPERIRNACVDDFTKLCPVPEPGTFLPWAIRV
ncbi:xanthine dehydrogenase/oxidase isoform X3 [Xenopus laevis]|uniref:Xanthine dehydrogenase/oxidase n=1 Tax=Xenopus laevis TaxID=8355 RepID=A0A8J1KQK5_XENLA|nr:xanthine dehydrogenase/oxidase isoform X3 [Xenopus laevis]